MEKELKQSHNLIKIRIRINFPSDINGKNTIAELQ